ncbi:MAG TPA: hypothetical protein VMZ51_02465 [Acidimicrobiales bacterium]|nr:hypothetical protein [Acidimicrobiales bacterium]
MKPVNVSAAGVEPNPARRAGGVWGRVSWAVGDQALSSATNIGTAVVAARVLDRQAFGAFGLAFAVYLLVLGGCRALVTEPLVSLYSNLRPATIAPLIRAATGAAVGIGVVFAAGVAVMGAALGGAGGRALAALALVLPGLLLQDSWRYCFVAAGRPEAAVANDAIWCVVQAATLVVLAVGGHLGLVVIVLWWGGAGTVAAVAGCRQATMMPAVFSARRWVTEHWHLGGRYTTEFVAATGAGQATLLGLGAIAGLTALGAVRGAQVFFGPINVLFGGIYLALAAEGSRLRTEPRQLRRLMALASGALMVAGACWLFLGLALPVSAGHHFFGDNWGPSRELLVPVGLAVLGGGAAAGAIAGLRSLAAAQASLRARLYGLPVVLAAPLAAAAKGPKAFAVGLALATWVGAVIWWRQFEQELNSPPAAQRPDRSDPDEAR